MRVYIARKKLTKTKTFILTNIYGPELRGRALNGKHVYTSYSPYIMLYNVI